MMEISDAARRLHDKAIVVDAHADIPTDVLIRRMGGERGVLDARHASRLREGGIDVQVFGIYVEARYKPARSLEIALRQTEALLEDLAESSEFRLVLASGDLSKVISEGKIAVVLSLEGAEPVESGLEMLHLFFRLGVRALGFTWNNRNLLADGVDEIGSGGGLTCYGREVLSEANRLKMILDVSHMAPAGVRDVLELSSVPVIASHSGAKSVFDHPRNLPDDLIAGIAQKGGVVGVPAFPKIIGAPVPSVETVVNHIEHIVQVGGKEHVGFGADFVDMFSDLVNEGRMGAEWIVPPGENTLGLSSASEMANLTQAMLNRGFDRDLVEGALGANFVRVFEELLPQK